MPAGFAAQWLGGPEFDFAASQRGGLIPALLLGVQANEALHNWRVATLLTALFLHASWLHLGANMLMLLVVGRPVEWVLVAVDAGAVYPVRHRWRVAAGLCRSDVDDPGHRRKWCHRRPVRWLCHAVLA
nr:rhomboid family intramembrane serine protease [Hankyongella ginsenosidimutans]